MDPLEITHKLGLILIKNQLHNLSGYHIQHNGYYKSGKLKGLIPYRPSQNN
jgi:hypothetical protein